MAGKKFTNLATTTTIDTLLGAAENTNGTTAGNKFTYSSDTTMASDSNIIVPTQHAAKTYADGKIAKNSAITGATKTKITYDANGLVTSGADATTADIADSTGKRYVSEDASAAITGAASPSSTNVFATMADAGGRLQAKIQVALVSLSNITLSGEQTIDGVLTSASRVLVAGQTDQTTNGIYVSGAGAWARATDANTGALLAGALVSPSIGTTYGGSIYANQNTVITLGVTNIVFSALMVPERFKELVAATNLNGLIGRAENTNGTSPAQKFTFSYDSLMSVNSDYQVPTQKAIKTYVDSGKVIGKIQVAVVSVSNITLSGEQTIDGVLTSSSRVLVIGQTDQKTNGIYVSAAGAWARAADANTPALLAGALVSPSLGTTYGGTIYANQNTAIIVGTTNITYSLIYAPEKYKDLTVVATTIDSLLAAAENTSGTTRNSFAYSSDTTLASDSNIIVPTQHAVKTYADGKVTKNSAITGATNTKITYDAKGLVTSGAAATTADIADSSGYRYVTNNQKDALNNASSPSSTNPLATLASVNGITAARLLGKIQVDTASQNDLTLSGEQTVEGVLTNYSRVLAAGQTDQTTNGIYLTTPGYWIRTTDANTGLLISGALVAPSGGTYAGTIYANQNLTITLGVTNIVFDVFYNVDEGKALNYTTVSPTEIAVGGVDVGSTFNNTPIIDVLNRIFYNAVTGFTAFNLDVTTPLEIGSYLSGSHTFTWATSGIVTPNTISIYDVTASASLCTAQANSGSYVYDFRTPGVTSTTTYEWRVGANTSGAPISRTTSLSWLYKAYWGTSSSTSLTSANVLALASSSLNTEFARYYTFGTSGYKYLCIPSAWTQPATFTDLNTGLPVDMQAPVSLSVTNAYGVAATYSIYRSTNVLANAMTIDVLL